MLIFTWGGVSNNDENNTDRRIDFNKKISLNRCTFTNFTFTKSNGECRIQGYITATSQDSLKGCYIMIQTDEGASLMRPDGTLYTVAMRVKSNQPSGNKCKISFSSTVWGSGSFLSVYYRNTEIATGDYKQSSMILSEAQGGNLQPMYCIVLEPPFEIGVPYYIDVTVKDLRLFEGAYVNPPSGRSIDRAETGFPMFIGPDLNFNNNLDNYGLPLQRNRRIYYSGDAYAAYSRFEVEIIGFSGMTNAYAKRAFVANLYQLPTSRAYDSSFRKWFIKIACWRNGSNPVTNISSTITEDTDYKMTVGNDAGDYKLNLSIRYEYIDSSSCRYFLVNNSVKNPPVVNMILQPLTKVDSGSYDSHYPHFQNYPIVFS